MCSEWPSSKSLDGAPRRKAMMYKLSPEEQRKAVLRIISVLFQAPLGVEVFRWCFRRIPYSWGYYLIALFTELFFQWLVGECVSQPSDNGTNRSVLISKCRLLEESSCKGMCVNMCKIPTQEFFTNTLGVPLSMEPDYENGSCLLTFGKKPFALENDPALGLNCLTSCPLKQRNCGDTC
eukprot:jgi/Galph1/499/GphlegSOOS_G5273.1